MNSIIFRTWLPFLILFLAFVACSDKSQKSKEQELKNVLKSNNWKVSLLFNGQNNTNRFSGFSIRFNDDESVSINGQSENGAGNWSVGSWGKSGTKISLDCGVTEPYNLFTDDWKVIEYSDRIIRMEGINNPGATEINANKLTIEKI